MPGENKEYKKTIGIVSALEPEFIHLRKALKNCHIRKIANLEFINGTLFDKNIAAVKCGVGKVSAAISVQILIDYYHPDIIINTGSAGALSPNLDIGDVVIATKAIQWDVDTTALGDPVAYVSGINKVEFKSDEKIYGKFISIISKTGKKIHKGLIVTGDQFVNKDEQKQYIFENFPDALCAEMEGAAVGHVCIQNSIPFSIIRCISDTSDGNSNTNFKKFVEQAGKEIFEYLCEYLKEL